MEELFATYTQAKELKELGMDEPCLAWFIEPHLNNSGVILGSFKSNYNTYGDRINAPLKQQVLQFFREKHNLYTDISTECTQIDGSIGFSWRIWKPWEIEEYSPERKGDEWSFETYEQAESECIDKLISILKEKQ